MIGRLLLLAGLLLAAAPAFAADTPPGLLGSWLRAPLGRQGVGLNFTYIGETIGALSGGLRQGWIYEGQLEGDLDLDLARLLRWQGATIHASAYLLHHLKGRPSADYVGDLGDPSNIEARATLRLYTLWLEQSLGRVQIRIGQLAADDEFMIAPSAAGLINGRFGWPPLPSADQVQGGPAFPLAAPGLRVAVTLSKRFTLLSAVFFGDPAGHGCKGDPQGCDRAGTTFSLSGEPLYLAELQWDVTALPGRHGVLKLGGWLGESHGDFVNQRVAATQNAPGFNQNWGVYAIADQTLWHHQARKLKAFLRVFYAPPDRNLISLDIDGGFALASLLRSGDMLSIGAGYTEISGDASALDRAQGRIVHDAETVFELSYIAPVMRGFSLQPDLQYILHPGGNLPDPAEPGHAVKNALVIGLRFTATL
jgi:porin